MKKKGSALILTILMLSFFMTITLTMYYIARNRNKRSIYKIKGMRLSSSLDSGSAIAHYELYLADEYVSKGHLYETTSSSGIDYEGDNGGYVAPGSTAKYTVEVLGSDGIIKLAPITTKHYTGVVLNNYNEYFAAKWDPTITGSVVTVDVGSSINDPNVLSQPWVAEEKIDSLGGGLLSRAWMNHDGEKIVRLWTESIGTGISVGGYRLKEIVGKDKSGNDLVVPLDGNTLVTTTTTSIDLTYEKIVSISDIEIGAEKYRITYIENVKVTPSGSSIIINNDDLKSMTVEKLK